MKGFKIDTLTTPVLALMCWCLIIKNDQGDYNSGQSQLMTISMFLHSHSTLIVWLIAKIHICSIKLFVAEKPIVSFFRICNFSMEQTISNCAGSFLSDLRIKPMFFHLLFLPPCLKRICTKSKTWFCYIISLNCSQMYFCVCFSSHNCVSSKGRKIARTKLFGKSKC